MNRGILRVMAVAGPWLVVAAGCGGMKAPASSPSAPPASPATAHAQPAKAPTTPPGVNKADVDFMSGMIPHHAQAVIMGGWAKSHGARDDVRNLCERIVVGQSDEILLMQTWLRDHGQ